MIEQVRLAEILRSFGTMEEGAMTRPLCEDGVWWIPAGGRNRLRVPVAAMPPEMAQLLELYVYSSGEQESAHLRQEVLAWLGGEGEVSAERLAQMLPQIGWPGDAAVVVAVELRGDAEEELLGDAMALLGELLAHEEQEEGEGQAGLLVRSGSSTIRLLLPPERIEEEADGGLRAVLGTLEAELYATAAAGVSAVKGLRDLAPACREAEFALAAGRLYRSRESVHRYDRLGIARLLYGLPAEMRDDFLAEVLPGQVLESLSAELRETIFAFLEHGQQVADTARSLYIHRNTLLYRLDRVTELTGYDIRKPIQGWTLWVALTLCRSL